MEIAHARGSLFVYFAFFLSVVVDFFFFVFLVRCRMNWKIYFNDHRWKLNRRLQYVCSLLATNKPDERHFYHRLTKLHMVSLKNVSLSNKRHIFFNWYIIRLVFYWTNSWNLCVGLLPPNVGATSVELISSYRSSQRIIFRSIFNSLL